ncbi:MAG TPA: ABC transporter substrate-binding protein [Stellaceae bacterium]|nr:ABC transporter substrate-binding protein [Stellaceae bacterium]
MRRNWRAMAVALLIGTGLIGIGMLATITAAQADPLQIRVGWVQTPGHLAPLVEALGKKHPEVFKHLGKSYTMQAIRFNGTTPQIQAQAINELEVASQAASALALSITNAHLDARVVADVLQDGHEGYFSQYYVVKADGPIKKIEDVKGHRIATNTIGSASDSAMRTMFHRHGIKDSDFTTVETNFATMPAMLEGGKVDMIGVLPQFAKGFIGNDKYKVLFTARDAVGPSEAVMWAMRADFIAAHRPVMVDFFEDHIRAVRWFLDPANHDDAIALAADVTKLPADNLAYAFTKADFYRSPDARPEIALAQKEIDESVELGVLPKRVEIAPKYVDLSLIEEAKARIDGK